MNDTTVFDTRTYGKDDNVVKIQMIRSHDTWVLLLVVSVLSTLLSVIVISTCLWICFKYCINPSVFKGRRQCIPRYNQNFPPGHREFVELEEFGEGINSYLNPRGPKGFANNKTGASEQLGYRPNSNMPVPVLPAPRSWTPSPPFPQDNCRQKSRSNMFPQDHSHQRSYSKRFPGCHNRSVQHCCSCIVHEDCCKVHERVSSCQLCPIDLEEKLATLQRSAKDLSKRNSRDISESNQAAYRPPVNTPNCNNKHTSITPISQRFDSSSDGEQRRDARRKVSHNDFGQINKLSHTVISRNKTATESDNYSSNYILTNETEKSNGASALVVENEVSFVRAQEESLLGKNNPALYPASKINLKDKKYNHIEQVYPVGKTTDAKSYTRLARKKRIPKRKRANTPIAVFLESPSSEASSEATSALNRTSNTYWKLFHPTGQEERKRKNEEEEEEERYDATPSMSWDHLNPDSLPTQEILEPKVDIDPTKTTVLFYHEKKLEKDLACNVDIQKCAPKCNGTHTSEHGMIQIHE